VADTAPLTDPAVPELEILLGAEATDLLAAALAGAGGAPRSVGIAQIRYVPGKRVTVQYRAEVAWSDGTTTREVFVAAAGLPVPEDVPVIGDDDIAGDWTGLDI